MSNVILSTDLMLQSQLQGAAARAGAKLAVSGSVDDLIAKIETSQPALVIIDLNFAGLRPDEVIARIRSAAPEMKILAFGPHVHKALLAAAEAAGADLVMSRGEFHARMAELLAR